MKTFKSLVVTHFTLGNNWTYLNIVQSNGLVKQHFIKRSREATIDVMTMEDGGSDDTPNKVKIRQVVRVHPTIGIDLKCINIIPRAKEIIVLHIKTSQ